MLGLNAAEGIQNAHDRAKQPDERSRRTDGGQAAQAALQLSMDNGFGALERALRGLNGLARNLATILVSPELHQASGDNLGQVAFLVALGDLDGLIDTAIPERAGHCGGKSPRLLARRAECQPAVDHDANRPTGHDE